MSASILPSSQRPSSTEGMGAVAGWPW